MSDASNVPETISTTPVVANAASAGVQAVVAGAAKKKRAASKWQEFVAVETKGKKGIKPDFAAIANKYHEIRASSDPTYQRKTKAKAPVESKQE